MKDYPKAKYNNQFVHRRLLKEFAQTVNEYFPEVEYSIFFGTLLGYLRDGDIIPWDNDVDVIWPEEHRPALEHLMRNERNKHYPKGGQPFGILNDSVRTCSNMFTVYKRLNNKECQSFSRNSGRGPCRPYIDIYIYNTKENSIRICPYTAKNPRYWSGPKIFELPKVIPTQKAKMQDFTARIPQDPEYCINQLYGENWKAPVVYHKNNVE